MSTRIVGDISSPDFNFDLHYPDMGCAAAPKCLTCPLPRCREDDWVSYALTERQKADVVLATTVIQDHLTREQAAERFGVTTRTISRIMQRAGIRYNNQYKSGRRYS